MAHLIVKSNVKQVAKDINIAEDVFTSLDRKIEQIIKEAVVRAKLNGRKTLQGKDI